MRALIVVLLRVSMVGLLCAVTILAWQTFVAPQPETQLLGQTLEVDFSTTQSLSLDGPVRLTGAGGLELESATGADLDLVTGDLLMRGAGQ